MNFIEVFFLMTNNKLKQQGVKISQKQNITGFYSIDYLSFNNTKTTLWFFEQAKTLI